MNEKGRFLPETREEVLKCTNCGFCQASCPVFSATLRPAYNPRGKMLLLKEFLAGFIENPQDIAESLFTCTMCQACTYSCPRSIKGADVVEAARRMLYERGCAPPLSFKVLNNIRETGNVFASPTEDGIMAKRKGITDRADVLVFMGCLPNFMDMKTIPSLVGILEAAEMNYTSLGPEEVCCGFPILLAGSDDFEQHAARVMAKIKATGARQLVTPCSGCYRTFKHHYSRVGDMGVEVFHAVEYIDRLMDEGRIKVRGKLKVRATYHDPCDLGRASKIFREPRKILERIPELQLVEMAKNQLNARCCGGGGGLQAHNQDLALEMAKQRVRDALEVGAEIIVSACPACKDNLRKGAQALPKKERAGIRVRDITEVVKHSLL
jgi:Fe-S oxidoreductase